MIRFSMLLWLSLVVSSVVTAGEKDRLPGTLNFQNITNTNIVQTVGETPSNEKEVEFGDFDNDGDLDVVVANAHSDFGVRRNKLYRNDDGVFNEISGVPFILGFSGADVTRNAFFRDYDDDGWLDIIVVNDANTSGDGGRTKIYMNKHPGGIFERFEEEGIARLGPNTGGAACGGVSIDANQDGSYDLYVGNYPGPSQDTMYFNDGNGFFSEMTNTHVPTESDYAVDVASADMNGDGKLDLLISNHSPNWIYYNDNNGDGSEIGDYKYTGSEQNLGDAGSVENAMEAGDFNNNGRMDIYHSNGGAGSTTDVIRVNMGNDANNKAIFQTGNALLPPRVMSTISRKATVADLNNDGRLDIIVMSAQSGNARPSILRNTSYGETISFIDWTPGHAFPDGNLHKGWHAAAFDANGDGWKDIFVGGWNDEHLFENVPSNEVTDTEIGSALPDTMNTDPVAVAGTISGGADGFLATDVPAGATVAIVMASSSDLFLRIIDGSGAVFTSSNRGGFGVEETVQFTAPGPDGEFSIRVSAIQLWGDFDDDVHIDLQDFFVFDDCRTGPDVPLTPGCEVFDGDQDNDVDFADFAKFQRKYSGPSEFASDDYILEVLSRD